MHARARLGLARSFQITSVLPGFSALENVALAVQARTGSSFRFFGARATEPALNEPAMAALAEVGLAERAPRAGRAAVAWRETRARTRHRAGDGAETAAARRADGRHRAARKPSASFDVLRAAQGRFAMLLVEHDMNAVFALADRISVLIYGRIIATGAPAEVRADPRVGRRLSRRGDGMRRDACRRASAIRVRPRAGAVRHRLSRRRRRGGHAARPQRHGQDDDHSTSWACCRPPAAARSSTACRSSACRPTASRRPASAWCRRAGRSFRR